MKLREKEFYGRLIQSVEYGNYSRKAELLRILKNSYITFDQTNSFTRKSWQYWEYVEVRVPIPFLEDIKTHEKYVEDLCFDIYEETDQYDIGGVNFKIGKRADELDEIISKEVHFEEIQQNIISQIKNAKYTIWIAVAWFTDKTLFDELIKKQHEGVNIQIIINDDSINTEHGYDFESNFETYRIPPMGYFGNIMHNKFCIVDLKTVIHGSYNWTKKAQYNQETILVHEDRKLAEQFADKFIELKVSNKKS